MIAETLKPLAVSIEIMRHDPSNVRTHSERNFESVMESLRKFGQQKPIVALEDGTVIAGNATLESARRLGWSEVAVSYFKGTQQEATAYAITDNRSSELADWSWGDLAAQLKELEDEFNLEALGWGDEDLQPLFNSDFDLLLHDDSSDAEDDFAGADTGLTGAVTISCTSDQHVVISQAIERLRDISGDYSITEGRCLELISADYISGK